MARRICVVTGSRSEYSLLAGLMKSIRSDPDLELQIVVTGMHLSPEFGLTGNVIEEDGFEISAKIESLLSSDTAVGVSKSIGLGVIGFADAFARLRPDIVVVLGDRYEIFAAAQAAMVARIPIAHLHGGELTEGAIDEAIRHSITKMAHLHFVAAEPYRLRVIQLGESPSRVFNFGAPGLDEISELKLLDRKELESDLNFRFGNLNFLLTYHPETLASARQEDVLVGILESINTCAPEARLLITMPNSDPGGRGLIRVIEGFVAANPERAIAVVSMGQLRYFSAMAICDVVIGNSSSGLIEAPALKRATINIGNRQQGRLRASSVIDCAEDRAAIRAAIQKALSAEFRAGLARSVSPYGAGRVSSRICEVLKSIDLRGLEVKRFHDGGALP